MRISLNANPVAQKSEHPDQAASRTRTSTEFPGTSMHNDGDRRADSARDFGSAGQPGAWSADIKEPAKQESGMETPRASVPGHQDRNCSVNEYQVSRGNPARLSPLLASLFPVGVAGAELRVPGDPSLLMADEAQYVDDAAPTRIQEFAAGRLCARRALAELGWTDFPLRMSHDRRPRWPTSVIGSIAHTAGMCGAVVARAGAFCAVGMDMEVVRHVTPEIWPYICTPEERAWLGTLREPQQSRCAALLFSAKESFYKCQFSMTRQWFEFDDVTLDLTFRDPAAGEFALRPRSTNGPRGRDTMARKGQFRFHESLVITGMIVSWAAGSDWV